MTKDSLERGQELLKLIKELDEFQEVINMVADGKGGLASITVTAKAANSSPSLKISRYRNVAVVLANALAQERSNLEDEFKKL